ncbi:putative siroheme synthase [Erysiphe neolycopersici]|uniref:Putative siroheme synthase n=1 Tax=Erysiphe neolycopersici TaxID=212602 RepID=A0A420HUR0_9PEZI|nr:putative siroheme synthase [Erysiphe neolycopersici]
MNASTARLLYNTTFSLYRLSPLYTGNILPPDNTFLARHARKFQDIVCGESLRGVKMGTENENVVLLRAGSLQKVTWITLHDENLSDIEADDNEKRGMLVTVSYENAEYRAIFLCMVNRNDGFHHFSLLLTKMPLSLRKSLFDYLTTTFDTRISNLFIENKCMKDFFEKYIADVCSNEFIDDDDGRTETNLNLDNIVKDLVVRIGFDLPNGSTSLKAIDIQIPSEDLPRMISMGETAGHIQIFEAIGTYLRAFLALDINNSKVRISRISCAAFSLDAEGKLKLTLPSKPKEISTQLRANRTLIASLIKAAIGTFMLSLSSDH